jgi:predicted dehydrogenase
LFFSWDTSEIMYKTSIIGLGNSGWKLGLDKNRADIFDHTTMYNKHPETELISVMDIDADVRNSFQKGYPSVKVFDNINSLVEKTKPDIISICTPTKTHKQNIERLVESNVKAIFCEKPMALNESDASTIITFCKERNIVLAVNYMRRWDEQYISIKKIIENKKFGELLSIVAYGTTALFTSASHLIDILLFFGGQPIWICGDIQIDYVRKIHGMADPGGIAFIKFENDAYGFLKGTSKTPFHYMFEFDILFSEGRLKISNDGRTFQQWKFDDINTSTGEGYKSFIEEPYQNTTGNQRMLNAIDDIIDSIEHKREPASNGNTAKDVVRMINLIKKSYSLGNKKINF